MFRREGVDIVMVKPGLPYLDILFRVKERVGMPTFAYQVSGEYAMIMAAAEMGFIDGDKAMLENLISLTRAGADAILTYFGPRAAKETEGDGVRRLCCVIQARHKWWSLLHRNSQCTLQ
jgi:porphobilinogen synthase